MKNKMGIRINFLVAIVILLTSLGSPKLAASDVYYNDPLSSYPNVTIDEITSKEDIGIYGSAATSSLAITDINNITRESGQNFVLAGNDYTFRPLVSAYDKANPDVFKYKNAVVDLYGNYYDLEIVVNNVEALPNANNAYFTIRPTNMLSHEDVNINLTLNILNPNGTPAKLELAMIFEDMDFMTSFTFDTNEISKIYAPYTEEVSTDATNPASYFDINTINPLFYGEKNPYINKETERERLRYYLEEDKITIYDAWNIGIKFDRNKNPEVLEFPSLPGLENVGYLDANLQNTPEQNFSVLFKANPITISIGQNIEAFGGKSPSMNNFYLNSPAFIQDTVIEKKISDENQDGIAQVGENLFYTVNVSNTNAFDNAYDVSVRDSLLENLPNYLTWDGKLSIIDITNGTEVVYEGDITEETFVIDSISPNSTVSITYILNVNYIPDSLFEVVNIVTDNGEDPIDACNIETNNDDCASAEIPLDAYTVIKKSLSDTSENHVVESGESIEYTLEIINENSNISAKNITVRDSMIELLDTYDYLTWDGNFNISLSSEEYTGSLEDGTFTILEIPASSSVKISYNISVGSIPDDVKTILNVATNDGKEPFDPDTKQPIVCEKENRSCDEAKIPVSVDTIIKKFILDSNGNNVVENGEELIYTLEITNPSEDQTALNIPVRDSMIELLNTYDYLTWDGNFNISLSSENYSGGLEDGTFTILEIPASGSVKISYNIYVGIIPDDIKTILNVATNDGKEPFDPETKLPIVCEQDSRSCDEVKIPVSGDTIIEKFVSDANGDNVVDSGEELIYTLKLTNRSKDKAAFNISLRDSMLESIDAYDYLTWDGKISLESSISSYSGNLSNGDFTIDKLNAGESLIIKYNVKVGEIPQNISSIVNVATDNNMSPISPETNLPISCEKNSDDCASVTIETITSIDKVEVLGVTGSVKTAVIVINVLLLSSLLLVKNKIKQIV